jgi:hypothetical protein
MSKIELPPVPEQIRAFAEGSDLEAVEQYARQIVEVCAQVAERASHRQRQAAAWANCAPIKPCPGAAAIRNLIEESNNG